MTRLIRNVCCAVLLFKSVPLFAQQQLADPDFKVAIEKPAYKASGPVVTIDEAHQNFHTAGARYKPFSELLTSDGYTVATGTRKFDRETLAGVGILVIANAGSPQAGNATAPAFAEEECDAVRDWVRGGGSLLLIADHAPFGLAAENLGKRFGVNMGKGWVFDRDAKGNFTTQMVFTRDNGLLGEHSMLRGRDASEEVKHIRSFTGQSLSVPEGATILMKLSATAREAPTQPALQNAAKAAAAAPDEPLETATKDVSNAVADRAQGIAMNFGTGRVVIVGEAAMFTAQIVRRVQDGQQRVIKAGMNVPGTDDRQFALNVMHWLSGLLD